jgi:hypothetical protein
VVSQWVCINIAESIRLRLKTSHSLSMTCVDGVVYTSGKMLPLSPNYPLRSLELTWSGVCVRLPYAPETTPSSSIKFK